MKGEYLCSICDVHKTYSDDDLQWAMESPLMPCGDEWQFLSYVGPVPNQPRLGQRCHTSQGHGIIVSLSIEKWHGEDVPTARVDLDLGGCPFVRVDELELF